MATGGRSRRRSPRFRFVVGGLSVLAVVLAVFAWQQGGGGDGPGPLNAIAEAAERTQREPGGHATTRAVVRSPTRSEPLVMTGKIAFSTEAGRSEAVLSVPARESGEPMEMQVAVDGTMFYMRSDQFDSLPDGKEWIAIDMAFGEELNTLPADFDAKGELELLEETTGGVQVVGEEDVRGRPTTRYRGTVSVPEQVERLREAGSDELGSFLEDEGAPVQIEAWIAAAGLVRRMRIVSSRPGEKGEGPETIDVRTDFLDFGPVPEIAVPDPDEVFDATEQAAEGIGLSGG